MNLLLIREKTNLTVTFYTMFCQKNVTLIYIYWTLISCALMLLKTFFK